MFVYYITGLVGILILFCALPFSIKAEYKYVKSVATFSIFVRPPIIPLYINLMPLFKLSRMLRARKNQESVETEIGDRAKPDGGFDVTEVISYLKVAMQSVKTVMSGVKIAGFHLVAHVGLEDAFHTAMLCGTVTSLLSVAFVLGARLGINMSGPPKIRIVPSYGKTNLEFSGKTIIETSVFASLLSLVKVVGLLKKRKSENKLLGNAGRCNTSKNAIYF